MSSNKRIGKQELLLDHSKMINEQAFSDVIFTIEKQQVYGHSFVCNERAPGIMTPKDPKKKPKKKKNIYHIDIDSSISHKTFLDVLHFVYQGSIDIGQFPVFHIMLIQVAAVEFELARLHYLCEKYLRDHLTLDNMFSVLKGADQLKIEDIKIFCLHFVANNFNEFIGRREAKELGIDLFQEAVDFYQKSKVNPLKPIPDLQEPPNTILDDYEKIYNTMANPDATFRVHNQYISCHKAFLAAQTRELNNLCTLSTISKTKETPECIVVPGVKGPKEKELPVISADAFREMIKFVYYSFVDIAPVLACELIPFARDYSLNELQHVCIEIVKKNITKDTALSIIGLTYMPQMAELEVTNNELKQNSLNFILAHLMEIDLKALKFMIPQLSYDLMIAHQEWEKSMRGQKSN